MAAAKVLDGKVLATKVRTEVASEIGELRANVPGFEPKLSIVQVCTLQFAIVTNLCIMQTREVHV